MSKYSDLLRDPRWQKMRLKIMERDDFKCVHCGDGTNTLNVHHQEYLKGKKPWEYPHEYLITLCEECHGMEHIALTPLERFLFESLRERDRQNTDAVKLLNKIVKQLTHG